MTHPNRIQVKRRQELPEGAVWAVGRGCRWSNPFRVIARPDSLFPFRVIDVERKFADRGKASRASTQAFEAWLTSGLMKDKFRLRRADILDHLGELRDVTLACYCSPHSRCHADVLLELANA